MDHQRAEDPVNAAKKALKRSAHCIKNCDIQYTAGVDIQAFAIALSERYPNIIKKLSD